MRLERLMLNNKEEFYLDVQGAGRTPEEVTALITKIISGLVVSCFAIHELYDELNEFARLRKQTKVDPNG